jgi:hypothetical protein
MKTATFTFALIAATGFALAPTGLRAQDAPPPPADYNAPPPDGSAPPPDASGGDDQGQSFQNFYDQLGSQGQWIQTDDYGYVFQPTVQDPDWAPYTDGHWVYTAYGWTWVSDEPWGWATYHYGRWVNLDGTGWCWVPGYTWAPAWVSWRYGGGYAGWAPLPPATLVGVDFASPGLDIGIGFHFGSDCDERYGIGAGCYHFLPESYIGERSYRNYYLDRSRNYTVINRTTNITNVTYNNTTVNNNYGGGAGAFGRVHANGPSLTEINGHARTPVQQVQLANSGQPGRSTIEGGRLNVYAPRVNPSTVRQARPTAVAQTLSHVQVNRGTSITHPLQTTAQFRPVAPTAEAITAAKRAQAEAPRTAHIATANAKPQVTLSQPITQLQPVAQEHRAIAPRSPQPAPSEIGGQTRNTYEPQHNAAPQVSHTAAPNGANLQQEAQARAQQEAQARSQQEAQARSQQEVQARSQQEAQARAQQEAQARSQQEVQARSQQEAQARSQQDAQARAQQEAQARAQEQAQAREQQQAQAREEAQAQAREEAQARAQEQAQARAQEQAQVRAEAQAQARAEAQAQARSQGQGQKNKNGQQGQ